MVVIHLSWTALVVIHLSWTALVVIHLSWTALSAFLNSGGGTLCIGVRDDGESGRV